MTRIITMKTIKATKSKKKEKERKTDKQINNALKRNILYKFVTQTEITGTENYIYKRKRNLITKRQTNKYITPGGNDEMSFWGDESSPKNPLGFSPSNDPALFFDKTCFQR